MEGFIHCLNKAQRSGKAPKQTGSWTLSLDGKMGSRDEEDEK